MPEILFRVFLTLVVLSPLPFGSNREWSWSLYAAASAAIGLLWVAISLRQISTISLSLHPLLVVLFLLPVLWVLLQISPEAGESWAHPLWHMAAEVLQSPLPGTITLSSDNSQIALMRLLSYGLTFFLMFQFCRSPARARTVFLWIAVTGTLYALYGLTVHWGKFESILWFEKWTYHDDVTSTFVNRNSFATYAGLSSLCILATWFEKLSRLSVSAQTRDQSTDHRNVTELFVIHSWTSMLALMIVLTALASSHSRGGVISTLVAVVTLLMIVALKKAGMGKRMWGAFAGVLVTGSVVYAISSDTVLTRLDMLSWDTENRDEVYALVSTAIVDNPVIGVGYGNFEDGFRLYRDSSVHVFFKKAHNTYLETAFELGIPATFMLCIAILGVTFVAARGVRRRHQHWLYPAAGVSATSLVATHALFDFSLQIPAVAITYATIMGVAAAQSYPFGSTGPKSH